MTGLTGKVLVGRLHSCGRPAARHSGGLSAIIGATKLSATTCTFDKLAA